MMIKNLKSVSLLFPICALLLASLLSAEAGRKSYGVAGLTIKDVVTEKNGEVTITFRPMAETMYFCPGADAKVTEKGIELTFLRVGYKKRPEVDYPAVIDAKKGVLTVTIPAKGRDLFVREGKKLVKLEAPGKGKKEEGES